jgi:hypothetical protein
MSDMFDKAIARREIEERNCLRVEANLSPVSVEKELRRCEEAAIQKERDDFAHRSPLRQRVIDKLLNRIRRRLKNPEWRRTGMLSGGGYAFYVVVNNRMRRIWRWRHRQDNS